MKKVVLLVLFTLFISGIQAQVGGLSLSKIGTTDANTLLRNTLQIESAINVYRIKKYFTESGRKLDVFPARDSVMIESDLRYRLTFGLFDRLEIGMSAPYDITNLSMGLAYQILNAHSARISAIAGINTNTKQEHYHVTNKLYSEASAVAVGFACTFIMLEDFSIDISNEYQLSLEETIDEHKIDYFLDFDMGYFLLPVLQTCAGGSLFYSSFENKDMDRCSGGINLGFTFEPTEKINFKLNSPLTLLGKNMKVQRGFGFALRVLIGSE